MTEKIGGWIRAAGALLVGVPLVCMVLGIILSALIYAVSGIDPVPLVHEYEWVFWRAMSLMTAGVFLALFSLFLGGDE